MSVTIEDISKKIVKYLKRIENVMLKIVYKACHGRVNEMCSQSCFLI